MTRTVSRTFPLPPRELVEGMLGDEYQRLRSERLGGTAPPTVAVEAPGTTPGTSGASRPGGTTSPGGTSPGGTTSSGGIVTVVTFPRRLPLDDVPGPLRSLAGGGELVQVERWHLVSDERCAATFTTDSAMPGTVTGTYEVVPDGDGGATFTVVASATIRVPLIGGRIAKEVEGHVVNLVEAEMDLAAEYVANR